MSPFFGRDRWDGIDPRLLDQHYTALSFFSEAGFRFFLPAYLIADVQRLLQTADPVHHLASTFAEIEIDFPVGTQTFRRRTGYGVLLNPQRYGAMTSGDHARMRLSVFTREESQAIVAYLQYRRSIDQDRLFTSQIDTALDRFWLARAAQAPTADDVASHLEAEAAFHRALLARRT